MKSKRVVIKKAVLIIMGINMIQVGGLAALLMFSFFSPESFYDALGFSSRIFLVVIIIVALINGFISIRGTYLLAKVNSQYHLLQDTMARVENLNNSLRVQRHDFLNHLQVVYGLMEMDEYKDAREYIEKVYHDIQKISRVLKTANPAINALLQAKILDAEKKGIRVEIHVASRFEHLPIPSCEFCRVLGNLLDNAIDALEGNQSENLLRVELLEDLQSFILKVEDSGTGIPDHFTEKIFEPGFTTKAEHGEGMGLYITKEILARYNGMVTLKNNEGSTLFSVSIPKET